MEGDPPARRAHGLGTVLFSAIAIVFANPWVDMLYRALDPRIQSEG